MLPLTPSQTVGPFFHVAIPVRGRETLVTDATPGPRIVVEGSVLDGAGDPVPDALIEIWQANAAGRWNHPEDPRSQERDRTFEGFGRVGTGADGRFAIETVARRNRQDNYAFDIVLQGPGETVFFDV
jgi:protocatechuate 3,4-dioxygenase alpha subunit